MADDEVAILALLLDDSSVTLRQRHSRTESEQRRGCASLRPSVRFQTKTLYLPLLVYRILACFAITNRMSLLVCIAALPHSGRACVPQASSDTP